VHSPAAASSATGSAAVGAGNVGAAGGDGASLGQSIVSGMLQELGLDGSVFSNPLEWPNIKSAMALVNFGGGLLKSLIGQGSDAAGPDSGTDPLARSALGSPGLPDIGGLLPSAGRSAIIPNAERSAHAGTGAPPGPSVVVNGNVGMDPRAFTQRVESAHNQAWRRNMSAVQPAL
jgi:hypothetical protein